MAQWELHVGDGVVAFFLAESLGSESAAATACISATRALRSVVDTVAAKNNLAVEDVVLRFGLHWGSTLCVGNITIAGRTQVTALGDGVNEAARIEARATGGLALASKSLIERLNADDAAALGIDPDHVSYTTLTDLPTATDKARRDAPAIAVCEIQPNTARPHRAITGENLPASDKLPSPSTVVRDYLASRWGLISSGRYVSMADVLGVVIGRLVDRSRDAPVELVWRAHTESKLVKQWMSGGLVVCEIDFRVGGKARYVWKNAEFEMGMTSEFKEIVELQRVVYTELYDGWPEGATTVTATFAGQPGLTQVTVEIEYLSQEARDAAMQPGFEEGFATSYDQLDELLPDLAH